jgi:hypothetical protein
LGLIAACQVGFCPDTAITRADVAVFVGRALHVPLDAPQNYFVDNSQAPPEAVPYINALKFHDCVAACYTDISQATSSDYFCPGTTVSRAEIQDTIQRCLGSPAAPNDCAGAQDPVTRGVATCFLNRAACPGVCP